MSNDTTWNTRRHFPTESGYALVEERVNSKTGMREYRVRAVFSTPDLTGAERLMEDLLAARRPTAS